DNAIELRELVEKLKESDLDTRLKSSLEQALSEKQDQTENALSLVLRLGFSAEVAPPQGAGAALPSRAEALTPVSPGQKLMVIGKLHNGSNKYWLTIRSASIVPSEGWVKRVHAEHVTIAPGE